jgi:hypothetical protein
MKRSFVVAWVLMFLGCSSAIAQNWNTVRLNDTVYFAHESKDYLNYQLIGMKRLKVIWVDSFNVVGNDTIFTFYQSIRDSSFSPGFSSCVDSLAATWLGKKYIHKQDGTEYYFNSLNDTITLLTQAQVGDSWVIAHSGNKNFIATISTQYIVQIDGVNDVAKKFSIQAYENGIPVADWYNGKEMIFSKTHGWLQVFDLFRFPNPITTNYRFVASMDSVEHKRVNKSFNTVNINDTNPCSKYVAGNEWISIFHVNPYFSSPGPPYDYFITHDSVMTVQNIANGVVASIKTELISHYYSFGTNSDTTYFHNETIINAPNYRVTDSLLPEYNWKLKYIGYGGTKYTPFYTIDSLKTICNNFHYIIGTYQIGYDPYVRDTNNCIHIPFYEGFEYRGLVFLQGFGIMYDYDYYENSDPVFMYRETKYLYIKFDGCEIGTKVDIHTLDVENIAIFKEIKVYPNPATDILTIEASAPLLSIAIYDPTGRLIKEEKLLPTVGKHNIGCEELASGLYYVEVRLQNGERMKQKVVIAH